MTRSWDAASYDRVGGPMTAMAVAVLDRLDLAGDEVVLDAGCGTGRATALLADRLPRGRVVAVDADPDMVEQARANLAGRVEVLQSDLTELVLPEPVDAVFSTATFHWILDHDALFARLRAALGDGGRLVAQCGGEGNIVTLLDAAGQVIARDEWAASFAGWERPMLYAGPETTEHRLRSAGFDDARCWLEPWPVEPEDPIEYLGTIPLGAHLDRLPPERRDPFVRAVAERLPDPITIDYVRLNIDAVAHG